MFLSFTPSQSTFALLPEVWLTPCVSLSPHGSLSVSRLVLILGRPWYQGAAEFPSRDSWFHSESHCSGCDVIVFSPLGFFFWSESQLKQSCFPQPPGLLAELRRLQALPSMSCHSDVTGVPVGHTLATQGEIKAISLRPTGEEELIDRVTTKWLFKSSHYSGGREFSCQGPSPGADKARQASCECRGLGCAVDMDQWA